LAHPLTADKTAASCQDWRVAKEQRQKLLPAYPLQFNPRRFAMNAFDRSVQGFLYFVTELFWKRTARTR
jgi:hypothetical protein